MVKCTRVVDYRPKNAVHYRGAEYNGSVYQSGRLPSKKYRALPWWLNTAANVPNSKIVTDRSPGNFGDKKKKQKTRRTQ